MYKNPLNDILEGRDHKNYDLCYNGLTNALSGGSGDETYEALADALTKHIFGHIDRHTPNNNSKILQAVNTVISERKCQSFFENQEEMRDFVMNVIDYKASSIAEWLTGDRCNGYGPDAENPLRMILTIDMGEPVGWGINKDLREVTSNVITLVLDREGSDTVNAGFSVKTAYPDISKDYGIETGKVFDLNTIRELDDTPRLTPAMCAYIGLKNTQEPDETIDYRKAHSDETDKTVLTKYSPNGIVTLYIRDDKNFSIGKDFRGNKISKEELFLDEKNKHIVARLKVAQEYARNYSELCKGMRNLNDAQRDIQRE